MGDFMIYPLSRRSFCASLISCCDTGGQATFCVALLDNHDPFTHVCAPSRFRGSRDMMLHDWIKTRAGSYARAAKLLGLSNASVAWRYSEAIIVPRPEIMQQILERTRGEVTPGDFHAEFIARRRAEKRANRAHIARSATAAAS
jgi:hypothetical protein